MRPATRASARPAWLSAAACAALAREALAAYPEECCGWVTRVAIRPCQNAQAIVSHPLTAAATSRAAFALGDQDLIAFASAFDSAHPPLALYHSHPDGDATMSAADRAIARSPWGDGPAYPVAQIVLGTSGRGGVEVAVYQWRGAPGGFLRVARWGVVA